MNQQKSSSSYRVWQVVGSKPSQSYSAINFCSDQQTGAVFSLEYIFHSKLKKIIYNAMHESQNKTGVFLSVARAVL